MNQTSQNVKQERTDYNGIAKNAIKKITKSSELKSIHNIMPIGNEAILKD